MRLRTIDPTVAAAIRASLGYGAVPFNQARARGVMERHEVAAATVAKVYSLPACRLCSQLIERGETAIRFEIDFYKLSQGRPGHGTVCWLHLEPCPKGDAA